MKNYKKINNFRQDIRQDKSQDIRQDCFDNNYTITCRITSRDKQRVLDIVFNK